MYKKGKGDTTDTADAKILIAHRSHHLNNNSDQRAHELVDVLTLDDDDVIWIEIATVDRSSRNDEYDSRLTLIYMPSDNSLATV